MAYPRVILRENSTLVSTMPMAINIDTTKFNEAHEAFKQWMLEASNGVPFVNFDHPFLYEDEIRYKHAIYSSAKEVLNLDKWKKWRKNTGSILHAVRDACHISGNLLEHRYGPKGNSDSPLYLISEEKIGELENYLFDFFSGEAEMEERFNNFAEYVRENKLGSKWPFFGYLAFLCNPHLYFPIRPGPFDRLLKFYNIPETISGKQITWQRYSILLELAEALRSKLDIYGPISAIEIQSYMWVVSYLIKDSKIPKRKRAVTQEFDFTSELDSRARRAKERERIGLLGEQFIYDQERKKLDDAGQEHLIEKVTLKSIEGNEYGYDILSFDENDDEMHIEVKTTTLSPSNDNGFWLSENERQIAAGDDRWCVYRVWNIDALPVYENLGNIVLQKNKSWSLKVSGWYACHQR